MDAGNLPATASRHQGTGPAPELDGGHELAATRAPAGRAEPVASYRSLVGYALALVLLAVLALIVHTHHVLQVDVTVTRAIQRFHPNWFDWLMRRISDPGETRGALIGGAVVAVVLLALRTRLAAAVAFVATVLAIVTGDVVKLLVDRPRPTPGLVQVAQHINERSFPSGHVVHYTVLCGFLCYVILTRWPPSWTRTVGLVLLALPVLLVGVSRIYLGEHWASDVVGGYLLGAIFLGLAIQTYDRLRARYVERRPEIPDEAAVQAIP